ncbi:hypothetical protein [Bradyrhizobium sp.]|uniref:hypothetical protein n=1 Tax=Bradyrhizobium sp. TaxID=376 RepID=UPI0039E6E532
MNPLVLAFGAFVVSVGVANADDVIRLKAIDLAAQTHKWDGKTVETELLCFYADLNEFRCVGSSVRIDFTKLTPDDARKKIERDCDTMSKAMRPACIKRIRFIYSGFTSEETSEGKKLTLIQTKDDAGEIVAK